MAHLHRLKKILEFYEITDEWPLEDFEALRWAIENLTERNPSMFAYPTSIPVEEAKELFAYLRGGTTTSVAAAVRDTWVLAGYGLSLGLPVPMQMQNKSEDALREELASALEPLTKEGMQVGRFDWKMLLQLLLQFLPFILAKE